MANAFISFFCKDKLCLSFGILGDSVAPAEAVRSGIYWHNFKPITVLPTSVQSKAGFAVFGVRQDLLYLYAESLSRAVASLTELVRIQLLPASPPPAAELASQTEPGEGTGKSKTGWNSVDRTWTEDLE